MARCLAIAALALLLAACASAPKRSASEPVALPEGGAIGRAALPNARKRSPYAAAQEDMSKRGDYTAGGLYAPHIADSAPDGSIDVDAIPEPDVVDEPRSPYGNKTPYSVLGKSYRVLDSTRGYDETGTASYYGNKFHGRRTSNHEVYDMYAFTAAHRTLPLPSFARVTNLDNGRSVVVRVNDRGPFHDGRLLDLSYAAAVKLGIHLRGTGRVEVVGLSPGENARNDDGVLARAAGPTPATTLAGASPLPPGVRIATGRPAPVRSAPPAATTTTTGSVMDVLVNALPIASANASERPPPVPSTTSAARASASGGPAAGASGDLDWRFDMRQDGRAMSANEFDAWMKARRARVATGKAGQPDPYGAAAPEAKAASAARQKTDERRLARAVEKAKPAEETKVAAREADAAPPPPVVPAIVGKGVTLQVAAFGARANADRAMSMLKGAGVSEARVFDGTSAGKPIFRVRVGPVEGARVAELSARVAGLGFGQPQVVRE